jgi:hypothetical protein
MWKDRASLIFSLLFSLMLLGGVAGIECGSVLEDLRAMFGASFVFVLVVYPIALAFALVGLILEYFRMFADRGTPSRLLMSRGRVMLLAYGLASFLLLAHLSAKYLCR